MKQLTITMPDDWHLHLRDGDALQHTVPASTAHFSRALAMPNLVPPLIHSVDVLAYRQRIMEYRPKGSSFECYMTLYLSEETLESDLIAASQNPHMLGAKLYPAGATTHSDAGVRCMKALYPLFETMQSLDLVLQIHGEVTDPNSDIFDREALFIQQELMPLMANFPHLRIVLEHLSTQQGVEFVTHAPKQVAATITPQHLLYQRNDMLMGGIKPHLYCLPILKAQKHQRALQAAAISGNPKFFLGTDSAPHAIGNKESACGCAGVYSAPYALALYAEIFDSLNALDKLEAFASHFGSDFYQLPRNSSKITLHKQAQTVATTLPFGKESIVPIKAGEQLSWTVSDE